MKVCLAVVMLSAMLCPGDAQQQLVIPDCASDGDTDCSSVCAVGSTESSQCDVVTNWDTSTITIFSHMFLNATSFNADISSWVVSSGTDFTGMFAGATSFNADISSWDVSSGTRFAGMFFDATSFNADISSWDVSSGTDFTGMFEGATALRSAQNGCLYFKIWNWFRKNNSFFETDKTTIIPGACFGESTTESCAFCDIEMFPPYELHKPGIAPTEQNFKNTDVSCAYDIADCDNIGTFDVKEMTSLESKFLNTRLFNADISRWDVKNVVNFGSAFYLARNFDHDISSWNVSSGTDFSYMFYGASALRAAEGGCRYYRIAKSFDSQNDEFCVNSTSFSFATGGDTYSNCFDLGCGANFEACKAACATSPSGDEDDSGLSPGEIAGIVIGALAGIVIISIFIIKGVYGTIGDCMSKFTTRSAMKGDEQLAALM